MENISNHENIKLIVNKKRHLNYAMKPGFKKSTMFSKNPIGADLREIKIKMVKQIYLGQRILDFRKLVLLNIIMTKCFRSIETNTNYVTWKLAVLLCTLRHITFRKTMQTILNQFELKQLL